MTPGSRRLLGNIILSIAVIILVVTFCGMLGWIPKFAPTQSMTGLVVILAIVAATLRRRSTAPNV
jgi:hypothetical protein